MAMDAKSVQEEARIPVLDVQHQAAAAALQQEGPESGTTSSDIPGGAAAAAPVSHEQQPDEDKKEQQVQPAATQSQQREEAAEDLSLMVFYKVLPCSQNHSWSSCPYRHVGEKAQRRSLLLHSYTAQICPDVRKKSGCPRGDSCTLTHSMFELHLHPQRYRTVLCKDSQDCRRPFCFFAHNAGELRTPCEDLPDGLDDAEKLSGLCLQLAAKAAAVAAELADANTIAATSCKEAWPSSGASRSPRQPPGSFQLQPRMLPADPAVLGRSHVFAAAYTTPGSQLQVAASSTGGTQLAQAGPPNMLLQDAFGRLDLHQPVRQQHYTPVAADTAALMACTGHIGTTTSAAAAAWPSDHTRHGLSVPVQQPSVQPWPSTLQHQQQASAFSAAQAGHGPPGLLEQAHPGAAGSSLQQVVFLQQQQQQQPPPWFAPLSQQVVQHQAQQQLALPLVVSPQQLPLLLQPQPPPPQPQQHVAVGVQQQQSQWMLLAVPAASADLAAGSHTSSTMPAHELVYVMQPQPMAANPPAGNSATGQQGPYVWRQP